MVIEASKSKFYRILRPRLDLIRMSKGLPSNLIIPVVGHSHFYQIGLTFFKPREPVKRTLLFNPFFRLFMTLVYLGRSCASFFVAPIPENREYIIKSGDFMYFIQAKTQFNIAATEYMMVSISIMITNYIRYRFHTYPTFFAIFDFLSGRKTPGEVGLRKRENVKSLVIKSHAALKLVRFSNWLVFWVSLVLSFLPAALDLSYLELVLYALPWSTVFAISSFYTFSTYFWNLAYFYILCHYIKIQMRETNELAARMVYYRKRFNRPVDIRYLQSQYASVLERVRSYNSTYWSTYLFLVVTFLSTFNNTCLYIALYIDLNMIIQISLFYACFNSCLAIIFVLNTASIIQTELERSRSIVKSLYVQANCVMSYRQLYKMLEIIESMHTNIGFSFLNMFIINYSHFFEIVAMIMAYFLKTIDLFG